MSECEKCFETPRHPNKKCCFNCGKDSSRCDIWHHCGENCIGWVSKHNIIHGRKYSPVIIYEDDHWIIEKIFETNANSQIRITCFKDNHYVDDMILTKKMFQDKNNILDEAKKILYLGDYK